MDELRSLQDKLQNLRLIFDESIKDGKTFSDVKDIYLQIKDLEKAIYERKVSLKREGSFEDKK
jgi:hypothetical protein